MEAFAGHGFTPTGIKPKAPVERLPVPAGWRFGEAWCVVLMDA